MLPSLSVTTASMRTASTATRNFGVCGSFAAMTTEPSTAVASRSLIPPSYAGNPSPKATWRPRALPVSVSNRALDLLMQIGRRAVEDLGLPSAAIEDDQLGHRRDRAERRNPLRRTHHDR